MVDVCISKVLFRRFEMVNYVTFCVFSEQFLSLNLTYRLSKRIFTLFCHIDLYKDDSLYYKAFPYQLNDVGSF